jgi:hypothetical protein
MASHTSSSLTTTAVPGPHMRANAADKRKVMAVDDGPSAISAAPWGAFTNNAVASWAATLSAVVNLVVIKRAVLHATNTIPYLLVRAPTHSQAGH